jgi:hypothetical protein
MAKVIAYLIYFAVFTYCYYGLNKKLSNKWIFILYPLIFCASIYPIKIWFDYFRPAYGDVLAKRWLSIILMMFNSLIVFNIAYGIVNLLTKPKEVFPQAPETANERFIKFITSGTIDMRTLAHFFFYTGGVLTMYAAVKYY